LIIVISTFDAALIATHQLLKLKVKHIASNKLHQWIDRLV